MHLKKTAIHERLFLSRFFSSFVLCQRIGLVLLYWLPKVALYVWDCYGNSANSKNDLAISPSLPFDLASHHTVSFNSSFTSFFCCQSI